MWAFVRAGIVEVILVADAKDGLCFFLSLLNPILNPPNEYAL
jgi:hypothetical protein